MKKISLNELAEKIDAQLVGDGSVEINNLTSLQKAQPDQLTYIESMKYAAKAADTKAAALLTSQQLENFEKPQLIVKNINAAVIDILNLFAPKLKPVEPGVNSSAFIETTAKVAATASIGPNCCIGHNAVIGENCILASGVSIGENTQIEENTRLDSNVVVYHNCKIGKNCLIQAGSVIGAIGFGYSFIDGQHRLIPHNGGVIIEDCVHIGANCCIDRAKFGDTIIGAGTKMDNLIQFGHGSRTGKCCIIVSQVGIAGSVEIGNGVVIGGQVGIANLVKIGDGTKIGAQSGLMSDVGPGLELLGAPAVDAKERFRQMMATQKLPEMVKEIKRLNKRLEKLESSADNS